MTNELYKKLAKIQSVLVAPKNQFNKFGGYKYRSCEDILEALKPLIAEHEIVLTLNDEIVQYGDRYYVKATATVTDGENTVSVSAFARESLSKKGMDESQITGASSSYARKSSLNGLFCIDDTKDADSNNKHENGEEKIGEKEMHIIRDMLISLGLEKNESKFLSYLGVEKLEDLKKSDYARAVSALEAKGNKK